MSAVRTHAIVNPNSSGGRTRTNWPAIESQLREALGEVETSFTESPLDAIRLTREALKAGAERIIAVGGDGTLNEVVNGFMENDRPINPEASLGLLVSATGGDFRRTFDLPADLAGQIDRLARGQIRKIDIGRMTCETLAGDEAIRYFDNIASFGLSGAADLAVNGLTIAKKILPGKYAFQWGVFKALLGYRNQAVRIRVDDALDEVFNVSTAAICNGRFFGGGMMVAPDAIPDDGLFDVVIMADLTLGEQIKDSGKIYKGEHMESEKVTFVRGRKITATPEPGVGDVLIDLDGETPGRLPATFEIVPQALKFIC